MKVVLLSTGRALPASYVADLADKLDHPHLTLVGWHPAAEKLPLDVHIVVGPNRSRVVAEAVVGEPGTQPAAIDVNQSQEPAPPWEPETVAMAASGGTSPPHGGYAIWTTMTSQELRAPRAPIRNSWIRRARRALGRTAWTRRVRKARRALVRNVWTRRARKLVIGGVARSFHRALRACSEATARCQQADVIVALDQGSVLTAWRLARRLPNADVTYGAAGAAQAVALRREPSSTTNSANSS